MIHSLQKTWPQPVTTLTSVIRQIGQSIRELSFRWRSLWAESLAALLCTADITTFTPALSSTPSNRWDRSPRYRWIRRPRHRCSHSPHDRRRYGSHHHWCRGRLANLFWRSVVFNDETDRAHPAMFHDRIGSLLVLGKAWLLNAEVDWA